MPHRLRNSAAFEQKALAYDLILQLRLPNQRDSGGALTELDVAHAIAGDAKLDHIRIDTLNLNADLIESKMSRPFAKRHRMIPLDMANGKLRVALANPYDMEGIDYPPRRQPRPPVRRRLRAPSILKALTEFYGLRHSVKKAERDLNSGIDLGNLEQLSRMKSETEIESSDQHVVNAVEFMSNRAFESRAGDCPHRAQARRA